MGLRKFHPMTVKPLIVRCYQKHPSTLTNLLPEENSIQTRDISQEIGNVHMTNINKLLGGWERKTRRSWPSLTTVISPFFKGSVLNEDIASLVPCWLLSVIFLFPLLPCTCLLVMFLPVCTSPGYFQVFFRLYLQSASCPSLTLRLLRSWGLPLRLPPYSWYHRTNRFFIVYK